MIMNTEREAIEGKIRGLKILLRDTDYIALKLAEGAATATEYAEQVASRQAWRTEINQLEAQLEEL